MASMQVENEALSTKDVKQPQIGTQATMRNVTPSVMRFRRSVSWFGAPSGGSFPATIPANGLARFLHLAGKDPRSKGAVVYAGQNKAGSPCSWVLAWDAPINSTSPDKVYMMSGFTSVIDKISFAQIQASLDKSGAIVNPTDPASKTSAHGTIQPLIPNTAFLGADFSLMP